MLFVDAAEQISKKSEQKLLKKIWQGNCAVDILISKELFEKVVDVYTIDEVYKISKELAYVIELAQVEYKAQRKIYGREISTFRIMNWNMDNNSVDIIFIDRFKDVDVRSQELDMALAS